MTAAKQAIPDSIMDQAFEWAVRLQSGTNDSNDQKAFDQWLQADITHHRAWQAIQVVEAELSSLRPIGAVAREALDHSAKKRKRKRTGVGSTLAILLVTGILWILIPQNSEWLPDYQTGTGEQLAITLPHGALLWLNSRSRVDIDESGPVTVISLQRGEIMLDSTFVEADKKPLVKTRYGQFNPVGTRFTVSIDEAHATLVVIKGQVAATPKGETASRIVSPGQHWQMTEGNAKETEPDGLLAGAWTDGIIEADNTSLGIVLDELAKHRPGWLHYDAAIADIKVTGVFHIQHPERALKALQASVPVDISTITPYWVNVTPRQ
ncbi:MAG: FecR domain-containing protein [Pseudomonadota bacterium]